MDVSKLLAKFQPSVREQELSGATTPARSEASIEKDALTIDDSPVKYLTWRSFVLGLVVSMGGFVFGYSTGMLIGLHLVLIADPTQVRFLVSRQ